LPNGTFTNFDKEKDTRTINTQVSVQVSGVLPAERTNGDGSVFVFPPGYTSPNYTWFTFNTSSNFVDINWGIRSGCFDDPRSMFFGSDSSPTDGVTPFTPLGAASVSKTASMVYKSWATMLGKKDTVSSNDMVLDMNGEVVDLLGVLNFKRSQYRDRLQPGTFRMSYRSSGSTYAKLADNGLRTIHESAEGRYTDIQNSAVNPVANVGKLYLDKGVALFDLFKLFFPSSADRAVSRREELLPFITGSTNNGAVKCIHKIAFFSGSHNGAGSGDPNIDRQTRTTYDHAASKDLLNFYSGSYSQSLSTFTRDLVGVRVNSNVNFKTKLYFCRAFNGDFNYSANPSFSTGSTLQNKTYRTPEPETFITTTGLFNDSGELLAVGKLSQPLRKNFGSEAVIRLRLDF